MYSSVDNFPKYQKKKGVQYHPKNVRFLPFGNLKKLANSTLYESGDQWNDLCLVFYFESRLQINTWYANDNLAGCLEKKSFWIYNRWRGPLRAAEEEMLSRYFIKSFMQHDWSKSFGRHSYSSSRRLVYAPVWVFLCPQVQKGPTLGLLRDYIKQLSSSRILSCPLPAVLSALAQVWVLAAAAGFNCLKNACQKISSFKLGSWEGSQDPAPFQASWCTFFWGTKFRNYDVIF